MVQTREERLFHKKEYNEAHQEEIKKYRKKYNETHKEEKKEYYKAHKEEMKKYKKKYSEIHKEEIKNHMKKYYDIYKEECKKQFKELRIKYRKIVLEHYGNKCACCGETTNEFLCIDHTNNDGAKHRKTIKGNSIYSWLVKNNYPDGFQLLCWNCNSAKGFYGCCPHKSKQNE